MIYFDPFFITNFNRVGWLNRLYILFCSIFIILVLALLMLLLFFSGGIVISSTGFDFINLLPYELVDASVILFPKNSLVLWTTFLEVVFKRPGPASNKCSLYPLANDKNPYPLTYFFALGSIE